MLQVFLIFLQLLNSCFILFLQFKKVLYIILEFSIAILDFQYRCLFLYYHSLKLFCLVLRSYGISLELLYLFLTFNFDCLNFCLTSLLHQFLFFPHYLHHCEFFIILMFPVIKSRFIDLIFHYLFLHLHISFRLSQPFLNVCINDGIGSDKLLCAIWHLSITLKLLKR